MGKIIINGSDDLKCVNIPVRFIDEYMTSANGEFVKVYLFLLRALSFSDTDVSICGIADILNLTEKDVVRALKFWEQNKLLKLIVDDNRNLLGIQLLPLPVSNQNLNNKQVNVQNDFNKQLNIQNDFNKQLNIQNDYPNPDIAQHYNSYNEHTLNNPQLLYSNQTIELKPDTTSNINANYIDATAVNSMTGTIPEKRNYSINEIQNFKSRADVTEFLYMAHKYIGKSLSNPDTNILLYIYDELKFDAELIEYLIEYCVSNNHKSVRYMEKVALSWYEEGIDTVEKAKASTTLYSKSCYPVLKAFGISGRNPGSGEKALIVKWTNSYGFDMDIILDACNRTMNTIHQPSFEYADSILTKWKEKGIRSLSEIKALDEEYNNRKASKNTIVQKENKPNNSFNNFSQRSYNYDSLEKDLLGNI